MKNSSYLRLRKWKRHADACGRNHLFGAHRQWRQLCFEQRDLRVARFEQRAVQVISTREIPSFIDTISGVEITRPAEILTLAGNNSSRNQRLAEE